MLEQQIKQLLIESKLNRMERIQLLSSLLHSETFVPLRIVIPEPIEALLVPDEFPVMSEEFTRLVVEAMEPMQSQCAAQRKAKRYIADLKDKGYIEARGKGTLTCYHLTK